MGGKIQKTNALRILDSKHIPYNLYTYPWKEDDLDAQHVGAYLERPHESIYKTLVAVGDKTGPLIAVVPSNQQLALKALAKVSGNKKVEMLPLRDLEKTTGYIRGGCSPVGMKKHYPTFIHDAILALDEVLVSAGRRGLQMGIAPEALITLVEAKTAFIAEPMA